MCSLMASMRRTTATEARPRMIGGRRASPPPSAYARAGVTHWIFMTFTRQTTTKPADSVSGFSDPGR